MYRKFKPPFFWPAIAQDRQSCQSHFRLMKNPLLHRSAWPESSREASERFLMETLGGTQSERRRRLALAGSFRLLRSSGIDRLDASAHAAAAGRQAQMTEKYQIYIMSDPSVPTAADFTEGHDAIGD